MVQKIKYSQMFLSFWLQLWLFFTLMPSVFSGALFSIIFTIGQVVYFSVMGRYIYCFYNKTIEASAQRTYEWLVLGMSTVLSAIYASIIYTDPWLWQTQEFIGYDFMILLIWMTTFLVSSLVAMACHIFSIKRLDVQDKKLWNTYRTADLLFLSLFSFSIIFLTITNTKIIPGLMRDYWQMLRCVTVPIVLFILWLYGRDFVVQRKMFMTVLFGYFLFLTLETALFLFIRVPLTNQMLLTIDNTIVSVHIAMIATVIHWALVFVWLVWLNICEKRKK